MKKFFTTAAILAAIATPAAAQQVATVAVGEPLPYRSVPGPGKAVDYAGFRCLMMAPDDLWTRCAGITGQVRLPACRTPVFIKGVDIDRLACLDPAAVARN